MHKIVQIQIVICEIYKLINCIIYAKCRRAGKQMEGALRQWRTPWQAGVTAQGRAD
jgi:hypothetical protein